MASNAGSAGSAARFIFAETYTAGRPHLIVHTAATEASLADVETVTRRHEDLVERGLQPHQELADAAYISVNNILDAAGKHGIELIGPLRPDSGWQARDPDAYDLTHFTIDWERQQVTCSRGKTSRRRRSWRSPCAGRVRAAPGPGLLRRGCGPGSAAHR